jgi:AraC-like DNA-binding protein
MNEIKLINIIGILSVFTSLLLVTFLITLKTNQKNSNRLFAVFLILTTLDISSWVLPLFITVSSGFEIFKSTFVFLQIPVFYLYVKSVCYSDFKLKKKHLLHIIPFLVVNLVLAKGLYLVDKESKALFLVNILNNEEIVFIHVFIHIQFISYLVLVFLTLIQFKKIYKENYANYNVVTYNWLFKLAVLTSIIHFLALIKNVLKFSNQEVTYNNVLQILGLSFFFITCWYVLMALKYPNLFRSVDSTLRPVEKIIAENKEVSITEKENNETIVRLKAFMKRQEPFLEPSLTIQDLALKINLPSRELSVLINHEMGQHFFDFINEYRIEKAKELLKEPSKKELTVLEILYEVGFNSKSSFNTAFKKYTGETPTQYRKQHLNN